MNSISIEAPAKINLFLKVLRRREDGYHDLDTVMAKLALSDRIQIEKRAAKVSFACSDSSLPVNDDNLAVKAAHAFFRASDLGSGVHISLQKNIPIAAGLGGGSSDAAAVLLGLNAMFFLPLSAKKLYAIGRGLGADIPFFINGENCSRAIGIGDVLSPVRLKGKYTIVLVNPGFQVSTRWAYENFALTTPGNPYILGREWQDEAGDRVFGARDFTRLINDLESVTCARYPQVSLIKNHMKRFGAIASLMSGSGPTVFGIFSNLQYARKCVDYFKTSGSGRVFITEFRQ
jgi:4-diphosphocytidyl-2-C-methyl-D-erythritol kinase